MKRKQRVWNLLSITVAVWLGLSMASCGSGDDVAENPPVVNPPVVVNPTESDSVAVKIGYNLSVMEESLVTTRSGGSDDLIGVQVMAVTPSIAGDVTPYAAGVFDDTDRLVFKFIKGNSYIISVNYFPNAKNIVYKYADGTYGAPFSYLYGLQKYTLNVPVYHDGVEGGWSGDIGTVLSYLMSDVVQPTDDRYVQSFVRGTTPRYLGTTGAIVIDGSPINVTLDLCMMGITLNVGNFTAGKIRMDISSIAGVTKQATFRPGDETKVTLQIPGEYSIEGNNMWENELNGDNVVLYYTDANNETYLLATTKLKYKALVNYVFNFDLTEREDGSIGIKMGSSTYQDELSYFD